MNMCRSMVVVEVVVLVFRTNYHDNKGLQYSLRNIAHNNTSPERVGVDILELASRSLVLELAEIVVVVVVVVVGEELLVVLV